jgi:hypothetical protein
MTTDRCGMMISSRMVGWGVAEVRGQGSDRPSRRVEQAIVPRGIGGVPAKPLSPPRADPAHCRAKTQRTSVSKQALAEPERCGLVAVPD